MKILIRDGDETEVRNQQCGDWTYDEAGDITIVVRKMRDQRSVLAVAIHELIEAFMCREGSITDDQVCAHDEMFEKERAEGKHTEVAEPGDDIRAIYRHEHQKATDVEMCVCRALDLPWSEHEDIVYGL